MIAQLRLISLASRELLYSTNLSLMKKLSVALLAGVLCLTPFTSSYAFLDKVLKPSTKTKTKDVHEDRRLPEYHGVKHALGVIDFENQAGFQSQWNLGNNMSLMLESALFESDRFVIVDRQELGSVMAEQDLQASNRTAKSKNVAQTGLIRSARYLATGAITRVDYKTSGDSGGISYHGISLGGSAEKAEIEVIIKIIDTTTSQVVASKAIQGQAGRNSIRIGYSRHGVGGSLGSFAKTPLGEAAEDCIISAVQFIALEMEDYDLDGSVVTVSGKNVIINRGENFGVSSGDTFVVREEGEILVDPDTGEVLDELEGEVTATIEVTKVREKISYCKLVDGELPKRGDAVVFN